MTNERLNLRHPQEDFEPPIFAAKLTPHRSLGRTGFIVLMTFIVVSGLVSGVFFMIAGAWPVMIAMGLDVLAIWVAFKLNYRSGRQYEEISIWLHKLSVRKVSPSGKAKEFLFNPFWVRFRVDRHREFGVNSMKLHEKGRELELGAFLNPDERNSFANAFSAALADVRR